MAANPVSVEICVDRTGSSKEGSVLWPRRRMWCNWSRKTVRAGSAAL